MNKDDIFQRIVAILGETFDIEPQNIRACAKTWTSTASTRST